MKKLLSILAILAAVMLTTSCQKELPDAVKNIDVSQGGQTPNPTQVEKYVRASAESLSFTSPAGSLSFTITSNTSWSIKSDQDWCMVSSSSGSNNATLTVNVSENTSTSSRTATITISSTDVSSVKVSITQAGANPDLQLNKNDLSFTADAGSDSFTITSNTSWSVTSDQDWCTVSTSSGSKNGTITVNVSENKSTSSRSATITVKAGEQSQNIAVTQGGANATLHLNTTGIVFESASQSASFTITSNTSWSITSDKTWCTLSSPSGSNNATVTVYVSENTSTSSRSATITVKAGEQSQTITVTQAGANATLQLNMTSIVFESASQSASFTITSNTSWSIMSDQSWCKLGSFSGSNNATVIVNVTENTSTSPRSATITVTAGEILQTIAVTQAGAKPVDESTRSFTVNGVSFKMVRVDGGTFTMGATSEQGSDAYDDEKPAHHVTLSSYYIGETEVTQELWQAVMGSNPSYFSGAKKPVEQVSWDDCQKFIRKLNSLTGQNFRLPTEAEWEFAARGGNKSRGYKYAGSNTIDNVAWYYDNSYALGKSSPDYGTHNVATKLPNELVLYDMSGNVWEWCSDLYGSYTSSSQTNPTGPSSGSGRVYRGGGWFIRAGDCRASARSITAPEHRGNYLGLRLALQ